MIVRSSFPFCFSQVQKRNINIKDKGGIRRRKVHTDESDPLTWRVGGLEPFCHQYDISIKRNFSQLLQGSLNKTNNLFLTNFPNILGCVHHGDE